MERLLVTGIDSVVGGNLALSLSDHCQVLGLYDRVHLESPQVRCMRWPGNDSHALAAVIESWQPEWVVHCGPLAASSWDDAPPEEDAQREPHRVACLAGLAESMGYRLTLVSSDVVFAGPRMFHDECSPPTSPAPRAAWVRAMERTVDDSDALVVRTHAYGWSFDGYGEGFAERAFAALLRHEPMLACGRRHATPILASDLAEFLFQAYESRLYGLYHLAGAERTSPHRFVAEMAAALGIDASPWLREVEPPQPQWPDETSLSSKRVRRMLDMPTPVLRDGMQRFAEQADNGWRQRWQRGGELRELAPVAA